MLPRQVFTRLALLIAVVALIVAPRRALADTSTAHSVSVVVLALDSDDAEEQADALTSALRSRVRASQGWSLTETSQSLGMLTAALRCQAKPLPADCEQRIAEQLKTERYIYGYVTRGPQTAQVTAEVHLYQKNRADTVIRETYADNLKDQNDDVLRKIAQRVLDRLGGSAVGSIVVKMGSESGEVVVDGDKRVPLQNGTSRLELAPGSHSVEVVVSGQPPQKRNVLVTAGKETIVDLSLATSNNARPEPIREDKPFPTRKVIGGVMVAAGVGLGVFAVTRILDRQDAIDEFDSQDLGNPSRFNSTNGASIDPCEATLKNNPPGTIDKHACDLSDRASRSGVLAIVSGAAGGVLLLGGAYLLLTGGGSDTKASTTGKPRKPHLVPTLGWGHGGVSLVGSF